MLWRFINSGFNGLRASPIGFDHFIQDEGAKMSVINSDDQGSVHI